VELIFSASVVLGSHHPQYVYPSRSRLMTKSVNPVSVFLQHGIMGMRRMDHMYGREAPDFHVDLFLVSSEREKSFLISDFGYRPEEIALTGLSRFDSLFRTTEVSNDNHILVAPTWREGLQTEEKFLRSEYYARWREFINAEYLDELVRRYDAKNIFHIHPNMRHFVEHFESPHVSVVEQGTVDVQELIKNSSILVTDYSSVGLDFSLLHKPVVYYQFDRERVLKDGSHLDLEVDLPGPVYRSSQNVLEYVESRLVSDSAMEERYVDRANKFSDYRDTNNSERIFQHVMNTSKRRGDRFRLYTDLRRIINYRIKHSRHYMPVMKRLYRLMKRLPVDK